MEKAQTTLSENLVASKIYFIRDKRVMLDRDLVVRSNKERFPGPLLFQLTPAEFEILKSQIVTSSEIGSPKRN